MIPRKADRETFGSDQSFNFLGIGEDFGAVGSAVNYHQYFSINFKDGKRSLGLATFLPFHDGVPGKGRPSGGIASHASGQVPIEYPFITSAVE